MSFTITVEPENDEFRAQLLGAPDICATAKTRQQAIDTLAAQIEQRIADGQLATVDVPRIGVSELAGKYADDPTLREICEEAYRLRDSEKME